MWRRASRARALGNTLAGRHLDPDYQATHSAERVIRSMARLALMALRYHAERLLATEMRREMTVEEPAPGPLGNPGHMHGAARSQQRCHHHLALCFRIGRIGCHCPATIDPVVEPVQMHGMHIRRGVDDPPTHRVSDRVMEALGVRPRPAIHDEQQPALSPGVFAAGGIGPHADHQDPVLPCRSTGRVHHDRT